MWNIAVIAVLAAFSAAGWLALPAIIAGTFALAVTTSFDAAVRSSVITRLIPRDILPSGIGLHLMGSNTAQIVGPLVGGLLILPIGVTGILAVNVLLGFPIIGALLAMRTPLTDPSVGVARPSMASSIREGFAYGWRDPVFRPMFVLLLLVALLGRPYMQLLPAFANQQLHAGAVELSWLLGVTGVGALVGSLLTSVVGSGPRLGTAVVLAAGAFGVVAFLFALQTEIVPALVLMAAVGAGQYLHAGLHVTTYQARTPPHLIGRVIGASQMIPIGLMPLGALALGSLGTLIGVGTALQLGALALVAATIVVLASAPALRRHERAIAPSGGLIVPSDR